MNTKRQKIGQRAAVAALSVWLAPQVDAQEAATDRLDELKRQLGVVERKLELIQEESVSSAKAAANKFGVAVYGRVKFDAGYDTARTTPGDWATYVLPQPQGKDNELNATARDSRLGVRLRAPDFQGLVTTGLIETDFLSTGPANSPNPRLRLAYFDVATPSGWALRLGQDWDLFGVYHPNSVDAGLLGNTGNPRGFRPQVRVSKTIQTTERTKWVAAAALTRNIGEDLDGAGQDDGADTGAPAGQAGLALHTIGAAGRPLTVALSGLYGRETVDAVVKTTTTGADGSVAPKTSVTEKDASDYDSWLAHLAVIVPLSSRLALQGVVWTGANLDAYQAGNGQGVNAVAKREIGARGGYLQLTANATEKLALGAGYGIDDPDDGDLAAGQRARNSRLYGNAIYALTTAASVGVEVSQIKTEYKEQDSADALRVAFSGTLRF
ncbi:MAG: hypothetical protein GX590_00135 [Lentisphaerae bacterium]|nr:hypothetical protein [Lentisphaerota bacterium]